MYSHTYVISMKSVKIVNLVRLAKSKIICGIVGSARISELFYVLYCYI